MVDRWVGRLLNRAADLGLLDDTAIVFSTDHGFYLGEHGLTGKVVNLYEEVNHVPLMIRMPGGKGARRCPALAQAADIMPTLLSLAGAADPGTMHGKSLAHMLQGRDDAVREVAVSSWAIIHEPAARVEPLDDENPYDWARIASKRKPSTVTDGEWSLICGAQDVPPELYHVPSDPGQGRSMIAEKPEVARRLHAAYIAFLESVGTDKKFIAPRRSLAL
jgi:arylsulfatase A-like enzyme